MIIKKKIIISNHFQKENANLLNNIEIINTNNNNNKNEIKKGSIKTKKIAIEKKNIYPKLNILFNYIELALRKRYIFPLFRKVSLS